MKLKSSIIETFLLVMQAICGDRNHIPMTEGTEGTDGTDRTDGTDGTEGKCFLSLSGDLRIGLV